jgi:type II secretory pathway component PulM
MKHWANLQKREQLVLLWGGGGLLLLLTYLWLIVPLRSDLVRTQEAVLMKKAELLWMASAALEAQQLTAMRSNKPEISPLKVIDQTARQFGIDGGLKRVDPGENNQVKVWFEDLVYVDFVRFLRGMGGGQGLAIAGFAVERLDSPGIVNARVTFKTAGQ